MPPVFLPEKSSFAGKYRIDRRRDGLEASIVYDVTHLSTGKPGVLEIVHLPEPLSESQLADFERETASVMSQLVSPSANPILDTGVEDGRPWWVTPVIESDFLAGRLDQRIARDGPIQPNAAIELLTRIGRAIQSAYRVGIVHGHLTPGRILLSGVGSNGAPVLLLDFGVAHLLHTWKPSADVAASVAWLSPDQVRQLSARSASDDLWAFGLIAFFMITGQRYWKRESSLDVLQEVLTEPLVPASLRAQQLQASSWPEELDPWFARCVSRDSAARFHDVAEAIVELKPLSRLSLHSYAIMSNPKGCFYDDGLKKTFVEGEAEADVEKCLREVEIAHEEAALRREEPPPPEKGWVPVDERPETVVDNPRDFSLRRA